MTRRISVENRNKNREVKLSKIRGFVRDTLKRLNIECGGLNIIFVSDREIRTLNKRYLGIDSSTDVMAFAGKGGQGKIPEECLESTFLGDIAISTDKAAENARIYKVPFDEEIYRYVAHGILHLIGYDDWTKKERDIMKRKEDELLQKTGRAVRIKRFLAER